jgi:hypothetical protein
MVLTDRRPKGMQLLLEERGIDTLGKNSDSMTEV